MLTVEGSPQPPLTILRAHPSSTALPHQCLVLRREEARQSHPNFHRFQAFRRGNRRICRHVSHLGHDCPLSRCDLWPGYAALGQLECCRRSRIAPFPWPTWGSCSMTLISTYSSANVHRSGARVIVFLPQSVLRAAADAAAARWRRYRMERVLMALPAWQRADCDIDRPEIPSACDIEAAVRRRIASVMSADWRWRAS